MSSKQDSTYEADEVSDAKAFLLAMVRHLGRTNLKVFDPAVEREVVIGQSLVVSVQSGVGDLVERAGFWENFIVLADHSKFDVQKCDDGSLLLSRNVAEEAGG